MLRIVLSLLAVLPTLLPPGMCVCQFVPHPTASTAKGTKAPHRHRCSCCRHVETAATESSTRPKVPAHGWNLPSEQHDSSCPAAQGTPLPRLTNASASQLVMAVGIYAIGSVHLRTISLEPPDQPPHSTRIPAHLGYSVLRI
ncbi:MAG TPA: hypothetical protein VHR72_00390 [Gemmataceae bacterium]|jgi:hypothetical protein|nr:hypothetical protein [Gemmataceae bacterium]